MGFLVEDIGKSTKLFALCFFLLLRSDKLSVSPNIVVVFIRFGLGCHFATNPASPFMKMYCIVSALERDCFWRRDRDSNPRYLLQHTRFPSEHLKPLRHLSMRVGY